MASKEKNSGWIEKFIPRDLRLSSLGKPRDANRRSSGWIFLSHPHTYVGFYSNCILNLLMSVNTGLDVFTSNMANVLETNRNMMPYQMRKQTTIVVNSGRGLEFQLF